MGITERTSLFILPGNIKQLLCTVLPQSKVSFHPGVTSVYYVKTNLSSELNWNDLISVHVTICFELSA